MCRRIQPSHNTLGPVHARETLTAMWGEGIHHQTCNNHIKWVNSQWYCYCMYINFVCHKLLFPTVPLPSAFLSFAITFSTGLTSFLFSWEQANRCLDEGSKISCMTTIDLQNKVNLGPSPASHDWENTSH